MYIDPNSYHTATPILPILGQPAEYPFKTIYAGAAPKTRLICFSGAGCSASFFRFWRTFGGDDIRIEAYQPKGRESRWNEPRPSLSVSVEEAADAIATQMVTAPDERIALFGHSYGALLAYEVAQALSLTHVQVAHLIVAARAAPHMAPHQTLTADLTDADLARAMRALGLDDKDILDHPALGPLFLDNLRHDLQQNAAYIHWHDTPLNCPVTAISGQQDPLAAPLAMANWESCTSGAFRHHRLNGGHFLPTEKPHHLTRLIKAHQRAMRAELPS